MRRFTILCLVTVSASAFACSSLLGIEDLHEGPDPAGEGADGGTAAGTSGTGNGGTAGSAVSGAGGRSGGSGGVGGTSAGSSGSGGSGGETSGGKAGAAGTGTSGTSGSAGVAGSGATGGSGGSGGTPGDPTVRGRVVNVWLQPISGVHVMIGDASTDTDASGAFEIPDVAESYDAKLVVNYVHANRDASYGWVYEGLTRRDPTLQVYGGLPERSGDIFVQPNATFDDTRDFLVAIGSDYGATAHSASSSAGAHTSSIWDGPDTITARAHGLLWTIDGDELPTGYLAYDEIPVSLTEMDEASVALELPDGALQSGAISGTVTSGSQEERMNAVFVRFSSNANLELLRQSGSSLDSGSFSYTVPALPNSSITVMASEGNASFGALAVAHQDGLSMGQGDIALQIPAAPQQMAPPNADTVNDESVFSWTSNLATFVFSVEDLDLPNTFGGLYVVTARKQITLPTFPNGFRLTAGHLHNWRVETHGSAASVDELAGAEGFADSFGASSGSRPAGPRRGSGTYTISAGREFTTAQ